MSITLSIPHLWSCHFLDYWCLFSSRMAPFIFPIDHSALSEFFFSIVSVYAGNREAVVWVGWQSLRRWSWGRERGCLTRLGSGVPSKRHSSVFYCMFSVMKEHCFIYAYFIIHWVHFPFGIFLNSLKKIFGKQRPEGEELACCGLYNPLGNVRLMFTYIRGISLYPQNTMRQSYCNCHGEDICAQSDDLSGCSQLVSGTGRIWIQISVSEGQILSTALICLPKNVELLAEKQPTQSDSWEKWFCKSLHDR